MSTILILILLIIIVIFAIRSIVHKIRFGGGCCGTHDAPDKKIKIRDKNKSHYPFSYALSIDGMTCSVCSRRVENALNSLNGTWATVDLSQKTATVLSKNKILEETFISEIRKIGYTVLSVKS